MGIKNHIQLMFSLLALPIFILILQMKGLKQFLESINLIEAANLSRIPSDSSKKAVDTSQHS